MVFSLTCFLVSFKNWHLVILEQLMDQSALLAFLAHFLEVKLAGLYFTFSLKN